MYATILSLSLSVGSGDLVQLYDHETAFSSERNDIVDISTTADDFVVPDHHILSSLTATFLVPAEAPPFGWEFVVYANTGDNLPGDIVTTQSGGIGSDTGSTDFEFAIFDVAFDDLNVSLRAGGRYWIAIRGVGDGESRAFWGSANTDKPNGFDIVFMSEFFDVPEWTSWSELVGVQHDTAWTMTFVPAPGAGALVLACMSVTRPRRRRQDQI